jgi:hypothetical protein
MARAVLELKDMKTMTRKEAIDHIRAEVSKLVDDEHSVCEVAGRLGIMCRGFKQFSDEELKKRYDWIVAKRNPKTRDELEDLANRWQIARQIVNDRDLSCDVQTLEEDTCKGWNEFSNATLEKYYRQLCGEPIEVRTEEYVSLGA